MNKEFGILVRKKRERLLRNDREYSLRKVAERIGIEPSYLSKIERCQQPPPSESTIRLIAQEVDIDSDKLLALAGKVACDITAIILRRPQVVCDALRKMDKISAKRILRMLDS